MSVFAPITRPVSITPGWSRNNLWRTARAVPSLDLNFSANKSLVDAVTGQNLITFTRASTGTYVGSDGLIQNAAINEPRFDHNPTTGESLGLLVEEQRTNLLVGSEDFSPTNPSYLAFRGEVTANQAVAPDGATTADLFLETTEDGSHIVQCHAYTYASGTTYTYSVFLKPSGRDTNIRVRSVNTTTFAAESFFDLTGGGSVASTVLGSASIQSHANGWYRCSITGVSGASATTSLQIRTSSSVGDAAKGILLWGAQLEAGAFPTSYISTTTSAVTRSADVADILSINTSNWYSHNEGSVYAVADCMGGNVATNGNAYNNGIAKFAQATASVECRALVFGTNSTPDAYQFAQRNSTANYAASDTSYGDLQVGKFYRFAGAYTDSSTNGIALSVDGRSVVRNTTAAAIPQATRLLIGRGVNGATAGAPDNDSMCMNGRIKRFTYWPRRLSDSTLQALPQ